MSLARLLKFLIGVVLFCAVLWLMIWWQLGWPVLALAGAVAIMFVHAPLLALEFMLARWQNRLSTAPTASLSELCRAWWAETVGAVSVFGWQQPLHSMRFPDHVPVCSTGRRGLILIHGFMCNRGVWNSLWPRLKAADAPVVALSLQPVLASIDHYTQQIDVAVRQLTELTGQPPLLVAHSMGGLAVRAWLRKFEADSRVYRVVTVGTPHRGTWLARFGLGDSARQMQSASPWLRALLESESPTRQAKFTCYYSHCDNIVLPCTNATLPNADNRHIRGFAHVHLLEHPDILDEIKRLLRE